MSAKPKKPDLEHFIKKFKTAQANNSKDIRLSMQEATDIIALFALINSDYKTLDNKLNLLIDINTKLYQQINNIVTDSDNKF